MLELNKKYRVLLNGKGVYGAFIARLIGMTVPEERDPEIIFDNGVLLEKWQDCEFQEVSE